MGLEGGVSGGNGKREVEVTEWKEKGSCWFTLPRDLDRSPSVEQRDERTTVGGGWDRPDKGKGKRKEGKREREKGKGNKGPNISPARVANQGSAGLYHRPWSEHV